MIKQLKLVGRLGIVFFLLIIALVMTTSIYLFAFSSDSSASPIQVNQEQMPQDGQFVGTVAITSPETLGTFDIAMNLTFMEDEVLGNVVVTRTLLLSATPALNGMIVRIADNITPSIIVHSEPFTGHIGRTEVQREFTLEGELLEQGHTLQGTYSETITGLLPEPLQVTGLFLLTKQAPVVDSSLLRIALSSQRARINESVTITATLVGTSDQPLDNVGITFNSNLGAFHDESMATNENGVAATIFSTGETPGIAVLRISSDLGETVIAQIEIYDEPTIEISTQELVVSTNGGTTQVNVILHDGNGKPIEGVEVEFQTDAGSIFPAMAITNEQGEVATEFRAGSVPGKVKIEAWYLEVSEETIVEVQLPRVSILNISSPSSRVETGAETPIIVQVQDQFGEGLPGQVLSFSTVLGTVNPGSIITDDDGIATVVFKAGAIEGEGIVSALAFTTGVTYKLEIFSP